MAVPSQHLESVPRQSISSRNLLISLVRATLHSRTLLVLPWAAHKHAAAQMRTLSKMLRTKLTWMAVPVQRLGRCSASAGKASCCSSSSTPCSANSHSLRGRMKRAAPACCADRWLWACCAPVGLAAGAEGVRFGVLSPSPNCVCTCCDVYSFDPCTHHGTVKRVSNALEFSPLAPTVFAPAAIHTPVTSACSTGTDAMACPPAAPALRHQAWCKCAMHEVAGCSLI